MQTSANFSYLVMNEYKNFKNHLKPFFDCSFLLPTQNESLRIGDGRVFAQEGGKVFFNHIFDFGAGGFHHFDIFYGFHLAI